MKEKEQVQNSNGVSKAIIIALGIILLLSACGNITKMIFSPIVDEVSGKVESEFARELEAELEREFEALEKELQAVEKELDAVDRELNGMEIKVEIAPVEPVEPVAPVAPVELEYGR
jgi:Skp family chaperone for outer membrane proteins